jgi:F420-non-reducing hydrogenase small subunit
LDLGPALLDVAAAVDIVCWPVAMDFKHADVERLEDGSIAATLINGAVRTDEQREMAELFRRKSQYVVAFGACATDGGVPALANLTDKQHIYERAFVDSPTVVNPEGTVPRGRSSIEGHELSLPEFWPRVYRLDEVIPVDLALPGCPPATDWIERALAVITSGDIDMPPAGTIVGSDRALCDTCPRRDSRQGKATLPRIFLPHEIEADRERCLLEQGLLCCGPATRGGCGERCPRANMPCTGCFGAPPNVTDQGAKMLGTVASLFEGRTRREAEALVAQVLDPAGTFYRYGLARTFLNPRQG